MKSRQTTTGSQEAGCNASRGARRGAFTLIELLVVIAIIGALAALVLPLSGIAATKMRIARLKAELNHYVNAIESYKLETGEYPPDHGLMHLVSSNNWEAYHERAAMNPLYYELGGAIFTNSPRAGFITIPENQFIPAIDLDKAFKRKGIRNSARQRRDIEYKGFTFKESHRAQVDPDYAGAEVKVLRSPVPGSFTLAGTKEERKIYPWFYDASSTNRHNKASYDLWAEMVIGSKTNIIGNWKE